MTPVFVDSSYCVALLLKTDQAHGRAVETTKELQCPVVTTAWILTEVANTLSASHLRSSFLSLLDDLEKDDNVLVVAPDPETFAKGVGLYRSRPDKNWSLTDCISFVVMKRERITEALTADHHFEQAGFKALLR